DSLTWKTAPNRKDLATAASSGKVGTPDLTIPEPVILQFGNNKVRVLMRSNSDTFGFTEHMVVGFVEAPSVPFYDSVDLISGFPLRPFRLSRERAQPLDQPFRAWSEEQSSLSGGLRLPASFAPESGRDIPLLPIWNGVIVDTLCWFTIVLLLRWCL